MQPDADFDRFDLVAHLESQQIATRLIFGGNLLRQPAFMGRPNRRIGSLANADVLAERALWIGCYPGLTDEMLDFVIASIRAFVERAGAGAPAGAECTLSPPPSRAATVLRLDRHVDARGDFVKVFQQSVYEANGLDPTLAEVYWSTSRRGVVRGLHLQLPPSEHAKTVTVIRGTIHDVVVDLRAGSPTFHEHIAITLSSDEPAALQVPVGCAHGFQVTSDEAIVEYLVATEHDPERDTGVRWDSAGIEWPVAEPIVSARDAALPALDELETPFRFLT